MSFMYLLYGLVPLVVFIIVDTFASIKWAVAAALVFAVADILFSYYSLGNWDPGLVVSAFLLLGCGYFAIKSNNPLYIKLQPAVMALILAATFFYFQFLSEPLLLHYAPLLREMLPPDKRFMLDNRQIMDLMNLMVTWCIPLFLIHGALLVYTAYRCSTTVWIVTRAVGIWVLFFIMMIIIIATKGVPQP